MQGCDHAFLCVYVCVCVCVCVCVYVLWLHSQAVEDASRVNNIQLVILGVEGVFLAMLSFFALCYIVSKVRNAASQIFHPPHTYGHTCKNSTHIVSRVGFAGWARFLTTCNPLSVAHDSYASMWLACAGH